jgi:tetrahydromethanopterin S-methyltransferase subunit G
LESVLTPADSLSLILRRLDEIERKLDRMMEELMAPTAIGYSVGAIFQGRTEAQRSKSLA